MTTTEEGIIKLDTIFEGSTFYGFELFFAELLEDESEQPIDLTGAKIKIDMIKDGKVNSTYSNQLSPQDSNYLEISTDKVTFKEHIPTLRSGTYAFDIKVIFADEVVETGIGRGQWIIKNPLTK